MYILFYYLCIWKECVQKQYFQLFKIHDFLFMSSHNPECCGSNKNSHITPGIPQGPYVERRDSYKRTLHVLFRGKRKTL